MGRINGWIRKTAQGVKRGYWGKGDTQIWVYANKTWDVDPKTGNVKNYKTTHYTVQKYVGNSGKVAHSIGGKKFKTKEAATKFAINYIRRN